MKANLKTTLLLIAIIWFALFGLIMFVGEPTEGGIFDSLFGVIIMKLAAALNILLTVPAWYAIPERHREAIKSWVKLHFS